MKPKLYLVEKDLVFCESLYEPLWDGHYRSARVSVSGLVKSWIFNSVYHSIINPVQDSVRDSVWDSIGSSLEEQK